MGQEASTGGYSDKPGPSHDYSKEAGPSHSYPTKDPESSLPAYSNIIDADLSDEDEYEDGQFNFNNILSS